MSRLSIIVTAIDMFIHPSQKNGFSFFRKNHPYIASSTRFTADNMVSKGKTIFIKIKMPAKETIKRVSFYKC